MGEWDTITQVTLLTTIGEAFNIDIDYEEFEGATSFASLAERLTEKLHVRGRGAGRLALSELVRAAEQARFWKLLSRVFPENAASRALVRSLGFREVGTYEKHGCLDGVWRDVVIVELVLRFNQTVPCQSK